MNCFPVAIGRRPIACCLAAMPLLIMTCTGTLMAGPPLAIDDPGILDPGRAEIILASTFEDRDSGETSELPVLDASIGLSPDVQLSAVAVRAAVDPEQQSQRSDFGTGSIGLKWRWLKRGPLQMSVAPRFESSLGDSGVRRGVTDDPDAWVLPVQAQYEFASWRVNGELGYSVTRNGEDEWSYGVALAVPLNDGVEALAEIHGDASSDWRDETALYRIGADVALSTRWHLLVALGASLHEPGTDDLDLQGYLGIQWFP